ncbi:TPA: hypothetical protein N0F65_008958 [Lagenidium giganteum]|uniref:non-specific serine/threonine protein kinase n=1 Tax=Lagenidium giganteum TaxID=4803 RepID=A0AAV2YYL0_9STRA|nr:TPA: hypothetical protein N0F65_008958 [Lagenidium giganteum]
MEHYHILERIGEGSFGKVYRGRRKYTGHIVALKFVSKRGKSAKDLHNLREEISILKRLNHCNIIAMLDSFETEGEFCMVTEYAQGELFQVLEDDHQLPEDEIRKIAVQLIQALHVLHSNRIIHRDMKPQNILIGSKQQIKLADFGFARAISHDTSVLTSIKGTPLYMAPELVQEKPYNYTVDLWSLGVILYELAVGRPPFYTDRIVSLIQMIVREPVKYPATMTADFRSFLSGLLNKDPERRMTWPEILSHPFVRETPDELALRVQQGQQLRALPRFFQDVQQNQDSSELKLKPSAERLRTCGEWKQCDPETGQCVEDRDRGGSGTSVKLEEKRGPQALARAPAPTLDELLWTEWTKVEPVVTGLPLDGVCRVESVVHLLRTVTAYISTPTAIEARGMGVALHVLQLLHRSLATTYKSLEQLTALTGFLQVRTGVHQLLRSLFASTLPDGIDKRGDVSYQAVRCCMMFTTILNALDPARHDHRELDYRLLGRDDVSAIVTVLRTSSAEVYIARCKTLKWLGSMVDCSRHVTLFLEEVYPSGVIELLCEILHSSHRSRSPGGRMSKGGRELGSYAVFALSAFVQPDGQNWGNLHFFPIVALTHEDGSAMTNETIKLVKHLYKLRVKVHGEVATCLMRKGLMELCTLLEDELKAKIDAKARGDDQDDDETMEDADQSPICCILKILLHACRSSSPLSKKLMGATKSAAKPAERNVQAPSPSPVRTVVSSVVEGLSLGAFHALERCFAIDFLSVLLRRGVLSSTQIWSCARVLYALLLESDDTITLSVICTFFSDAVDAGSISWSDVDRAKWSSDDQELMELLADGVLSSQCANSIFRLLQHHEYLDESFTAQNERIQMLTCYNIRAQGLLDSGIVFLLRIATKAMKKAAELSNQGNPHTELLSETSAPNVRNFFALFQQEVVWEIFSDMLRVGGNDLLSPWGLFCFLKLVRIVREIEYNDRIELSINQHLLPHLVKLLERRHIEYLFHWPEVVGGGSNAVKALVHAIVKVLGMPFMHNISEDILVGTQEIIYDVQCVHKLLGVLQFVFSTKEFHLEVSVLELPMSFLSRLVTSSTHFGAQFVQADGMQVVKGCGMLAAQSSPSLIVDTLLIISQLARSSAENYERILEAQLLVELRDLATHSETMVRAKALNCIGNLCRHSTLFYDQLEAPLPGSSATVLSNVIRSLADGDPYVRRFACFAVGNAAFHSNYLYGSLRTAIPLLIRNLHDHEEKTRSNAAGALGNLVRNSDELCAELARHHAPWELFRLAVSDASTTSRRIALFSLGNFCVYPQCLDSIVNVEPDFMNRLDKLHEDVVADEVSRKNIRRILAKVEAIYGDEDVLPGAEDDTTDHDESD